MKKNNEVVRLDKSERIVKLVAYIAMGFCAIMAVLPCLNVIAQSFSMGTEVTAGRVTFWPRDFQLTSYKSVLQQSDFLRAMINSLLVTVIGTVVSLAVTVMFAYPLSQKNLYGKKFVTLLCIISMVFSGGTVPKYLVVRSLGLFNTLASLIIPSCFSVFDMLEYSIVSAPLKYS
jgi:putative aldouronate transport system permease protein